MDKQAIQQQALSNARNGESLANYPAIIEGFMAKGIAAADISPRENVFTFHAWKALGRSVRKGEHGVKVCTYVPMTKQQDDGTEHAFRAPRMTTVFHVSQTDAMTPTDRARHEWKTATPVTGPGFAGDHPKAKPPADDYYSDEFTPTK